MPVGKFVVTVAFIKMHSMTSACNQGYCHSEHVACFGIQVMTMHIGRHTTHETVS